ncbi:hypothetical protein CK510_09940 [Brunnivagina elsteri CCALA 953]|uniref:eCIS core domain-containing protein n=2 Tax=Brunnivagina TaxID=3344733 RepID=A0A2A2TKP7_9CYAN|nr:hypothetical protein CK510_09940 [Calothrix elsteri CCALA 953]
MPAFESEITANGGVQRKLINSPALPIQAKFTIGEPGDKYEQEADRVASQVVEQINAPVSAQPTQGESLQRQEEPEEELQAKPEITTLQRMEEKPEELQAKSTLQLQEAIAGGEASSDLTSAINSDRGSGQSLEAGLQRSMGQAMGADFSGVKVHTDTQADQLNQSIQARAFTTGQDVFFQQGEYNPGSRGGQELIAHELTHVVQQNGGGRKQTVMPSNKIPQNMIQPQWTHAEVTKESGAAVHKYKTSKKGEVSVKKGGLLGGGKLLTVPKGDFLWVDPENKEGEYVLGAYPLKQTKEPRKEGYINEQNFKEVQWFKDVLLARSLLDRYINTHKVQQHIKEESEFQESTRQGMGGLFAAINKNRDKGTKGFFDEGGKMKDPMQDIEHWKEMGEKLTVKPESEEGELIPMTCDQSTAIIISTLAENADFISSLTVIKQGDPKQHGHWYVLANRDPEAGSPTYGERLNPGEFIIDIWGSLRLKEENPGIETVVHTAGANAVFNAAVITKDQEGRGEEYVKQKEAEQNMLKVMLNVGKKGEENQ